MIIPEERLIELFNTLPAIVSNSKNYSVNTEIGTPKDLNKYLNLKRKEVSQTGGNIYPILWVQTPIKHNGDDQLREFSLSIVLATLTNTDLSNRERLNTTFKNTLNPLFINVLKSLRESGFSEIVRGSNFLTEYERTNFYNYGTLDETKHVTTDIWDAILIECNIRMNDNCLSKITF